MDKSAETQEIIYIYFFTMKVYNRRDIGKIYFYCPKFNRKDLVSWQKYKRTLFLFFYVPF